MAMTGWLAACGPGVQDSESAGDASSGSTSGAPVDPTTDTGDTDAGGTGTGTGTDTGAPEHGTSTTGFEPETTGDTESVPDFPPPPTGPFTCTGARWVFTGDQPRHVRAVAPDLRGHVLVHHDKGLYDLDDLGDLAGTTDFEALVGTRWWQGWAGPDAAGSWFLSFVQEDDTRRRWLHKYDVTGAQEWAVDLGLPQVADSIARLPIAVAPGGASTVTDDDLRLVHHDPTGAQTGAVELVGNTRLLAINDAGDLLTVTHGEPGPRVLASDGTLRWNHDLETAPLDALGDINASGEVLVSTSFGAAQVWRFTSTGEVAWKTYYIPNKTPLQQVADLALSDAGVGVVAGTANQEGAVVLRVDAAGEPVDLYRCNPGSLITAVEIDADGVIYVGGNVDEVAFAPFVAVFD